MQTSRLHNVTHFIAKHMLNILHGEHIFFRQQPTVTVDTCRQHYIETVWNTIDKKFTQTCTSVSCVLLVLSDLSVSVISNEEHQFTLHYSTLNSSIVPYCIIATQKHQMRQQTCRPVVPCLASWATHYDAHMTLWWRFW